MSCVTSGPVRHTRTRIICLRNDYKGLMKRIEAGLHAHHATLATSLPKDSSSSSSSSSAAAITPSSASLPATGSSAPEDIRTPFAKINSVAPNSPAAEAGMQRGDYIKKFGSVNALNHDKLKKLTQLVAVNEGVSLSPSAFRGCSCQGQPVIDDACLA
jgi:26S proteasome non-ATPase regulatory subunit 9